MAIYGEQITIPGLVAGADLSAKQYTAVQFASTAGEVIAVSATTDRMIGILQNDPADGEPAIICINGISKGFAGTSDIAVGEALSHDSTGLMDTATTTQRIIAWALEASSGISDLIMVYVQGPGAHNQ